MFKYPFSKTSCFVAAELTVKPIVIQPIQSPDMSHEVQVMPTERVETTGGPTVTDNADKRSADLHVKWIALQIAMSSVVASSELTYISERDGVPDPSNESFATNLIAAGKAMENSGTSMIQRGNELLKMIHARQAAAVVSPSSNAPTAQADTVSQDQLSDIQFVGQVPATFAQTAPRETPGTVMTGGTVSATDKQPAMQPPSRPTTVAKATDTLGGPVFPSPVKASTSTQAIQPQQQSAVQKVRTPRKRSKTIYRCTKCEKAFVSQATLDQHYNVHYSLDIQCATCGETFQTEQQLKRHSAVHVPHPFICNVCGKCYISKYSLKSHMTRHQKPVKCRYCDHMCVSATAMRKHFHDAHQQIHAAQKSAAKGAPN